MSSPLPSESNSSSDAGKGRSSDGGIRNPRIIIPAILAAAVFISGFVTMALEFAASRLLIPVFGSSISSWGVLIGIILAALTTGYHIGGRLADNKERPATLQKQSLIMFSAGLYILFIPLLIWPAVLASFGSTPSTTNLAASTLALIAPPTVLLGIVSPYAIKLATTTISTLGKKAGNLYSLATVGSIAGTFLTVFLLIPSLEITSIIFALGLALIIPASVFGLRKVPKVLAGSLLVLVILASAPAGIGNALSSLTDFGGFDSVNAGLLGNVVHREETQYSQLQVVDSSTLYPSGAANTSPQTRTRSLFLNGDLHSQMYVDRPNELALLYTQFFPVGLVFNPDAKNVLFVGGGGFSGPKYFLDAYPGIARVDVVEIDPAVIDVAKQYFAVPDNDTRLKIHSDDGRRFLLSGAGAQQYDIVVLDAYSKNYVPFHLMTAEYFQLLHGRMAPDGVIVSNHLGTIRPGSTNGGWEGPGYGESKLWRAGFKTLAEVFPSVHVFPTRPGGAGVQNVILVASKDAGMHYEGGIRQMQQAVSGNSGIYREGNQENTDFLQEIDYADYLYDTTSVRTDDVPMFTDQYAPVEAFLSPLTHAPYNVTDDGEWETAIGISLQPDGYAQSLTPAVIAIAIAWGLYAHRIWKKPSHVHGQT